MEYQNFTQYAVANGYPSDYDTMFEAQYLGGLGLAGRVSKRTVKRSQERASQNSALNVRAHKEYCQDILSGAVVDPSGEVTKKNLMARQQANDSTVLQSKKSGLLRQIEIIEGLGRMSHLPNGKLKAPYQRTVDEYEKQLDAIPKKI